MSPGDAVWLGVWEKLASFGFLLVILGVVLEGVGHFREFPKEEEARKLKVEKAGWLILVVGLAMEFLGDQFAKRIADREAARLAVLAGDANRTAEELRATNLVMQLKLQPRRITQSQVTNFVFLTEHVTKIPVKISMGADEGDTGNFASQLRAMLTAAGFTNDSSAGAWGVTRDSRRIVSSKIGVNFQSSSVAVVCYGTDESWSLPSIPISTEFQRARPIVTSSDVAEIYRAIFDSLNRIGIPTDGVANSTWVKPNEYELFVPPKSF